jgi:hypothetical protein
VPVLVRPGRADYRARWELACQEIIHYRWHRFVRPAPGRSVSAELAGPGPPFQVMAARLSTVPHRSSRLHGLSI